MRLTFAAIIFLLFLNFLIDLYIYRRLIITHVKLRWLKMVYWTVNALLIIGFLAVSFLIKKKISGGMDMTDLMWTVFIYFLFFAPKVAYLLISWIDFPLSRLRRRRCRIFSYIGAVVALLLFISMLWGSTFDRLSSRVEKVEIDYTQLPESFIGYKIVQLSDIHLGNLGHNKKFVKRLVKKVNELNADIIVFTGDLVNVRADELTEYLPILAELKAKDGIYSVLGNHDYGDYAHWGSEDEKQANLKQLLSDQESIGWHLLNNESNFVHHGSDSIAIIGVENWGEPPFPQHGDLSQAMSTLPDSIFKILLTHNPIHWRKEVLPLTDIALSLSGHTHAMQIKFSLFGWQWSPAVWRYEDWSGLYNEGERYLYVNDGIGYVLMPMRFGTRPEITEITLRQK